MASGRNLSNTTLQMNRHYFSTPEQLHFDTMQAIVHLSLGTTRCMALAGWVLIRFITEGQVDVGKISPAPTMYCYYAMLAN